MRTSTMKRFEKAEQHMTRYPIIKRSASGGMLALTSAFACQLFLACVGLYAPASAQAASVSIPGAISVTIQPPEAVADGARGAGGGRAVVGGWRRRASVRRVDYESGRRDARGPV